MFFYSDPKTSPFPTVNEVHTKRASIMKLLIQMSV